jgi:hypothetical protein
MDEQQYTLTFENGSVADANRWASELKEFILDATDEVVVEQQRDNPYSQDLGAILSLALGAPAVVAVAKALGQWLALHREAGITIKTPRGEIVATNLTNKDIMKLAELMLSQKE